MKNLTIAERMQRLYLGEKLDRVPFIASATMFCAKQKNLSCNDFYFNPNKSYKAQKEIIELIGSDDKPCYDLPNGEILDLGGKLYFGSEQICLPKTNPLIKNTEDMLAYILPNKKDWKNLENKIAFLDFFKTKGQNGVSICGGSPFTMLGSLMETEFMMKALIKESNLVEHLLLIMEEYLKESANILIDRYGIENCSVGYNLPFENNELISPRIFKKLAFPSLQRLHKYFLSLGISNFSLHLCGKHMQNLNFLREFELPKKSFISLDEKNSFDEVFNTFGYEHIYAGNLSSNALVHSSPSEVYELAKNIISQTKGKSFGFVLMPSCDLPIDTNLNNLKAMLKACENKEI